MSKPKYQKGLEQLNMYKPKMKRNKLREEEGKKTKNRRTDARESGKNELVSDEDSVILNFKPDLSHS